MLNNIVLFLLGEYLQLQGAAAKMSPKRTNHYRYTRMTSCPRFSEHLDFISFNL